MLQRILRHFRPSVPKPDLGSRNRKVFLFKDQVRDNIFWTAGVAVLSYFECNYGEAGIPLDQWFGTFRDGLTDGAGASLPEEHRTPDRG